MYIVSRTHTDMALYGCYVSDRLSGGGDGQCSPVNGTDDDNDDGLCVCATGVWSN